VWWETIAATDCLLSQ